ncbi:Uncharacterised protein [Algoriella xinjiangensis]|nr:Uncharacterised protein [Algoriella xinjiangensis]
MKQKFQYLGIFFGVIYGLIIRILGDNEIFEDYYNIYSISSKKAKSAFDLGATP